MRFTSRFVSVLMTSLLLLAANFAPLPVSQTFAREPYQLTPVQLEFFNISPQSRAVVDVTDKLIDRINNYRWAEGVPNWRLRRDSRLVNSAVWFAQCFTFNESNPHLDNQKRGTSQRIRDYGVNRGTEVVYWESDWRKNDPAEASLERAVGWWNGSDEHYRELHREDLRIIGVGAAQIFETCTRQKLNPSRSVYVVDMAP